MELTWARRQRQDFIRARLEAAGHINRRDLAEKFSVSIQTATADLNLYRELVGGIAYNASLKRFEAATSEAST